MTPQTTLTNSKRPDDYDENDSDDDDDEDLQMSLSDLVARKRPRSSPEKRVAIPGYNDEMALTTSTCRKTPVNPSSFTTFIRQASVPSVRRCFSHAAIDFIPFKSKKLSFHDRLWQRSITGCRRRVTFLSWHKTWKSPRWVALSLTPTPTRTPIECMAWDTLGVLLCVADSRTIQVYDWDTVRAADLMGKTEWQRQAKSLYQIPPLLLFQVPYPVSHLQWNPHHPDQLAVGFKVQGIAHIYQLDKVVAWQDKQAKRSIQSSPYPPPTCFRTLQPPSPSNGTVSFIFFDKRDKASILVSIGSSVYCWNDESLQWRYQSPSPCTCIRSLWLCPWKSWILLSTQEGKFVILDSQRKKRTAFSSHDKPIVIHEWTSKTQAVVDCQVIGVLDTAFHLMWVTSAGWVYQVEVLVNHLPPSSAALSSSSSPLSNSIPETRPMTTTKRKLFDTKSKPPSRATPSITFSISPPIVIYSPPKVAVFNSQNEHIADDQYSLPPQPMIAHHNKSWWVWPEVAKVSKYLGHHNKYVVDRLKIVRESEPALLLYCQGDQVRIPVAKLPQVMALHPEREWMVLGVDKELLLLVNRS